MNGRRVGIVRLWLRWCFAEGNLAKSTWGLSKFLIANQHANVSQVKTAASDWLQFSNPDGYTGDACFTKGCNRSFERNGCGGMEVEWTGRSGDAWHDVPDAQQRKP